MSTESSALPDPRTLTTLPEILSCLSAYESAEAKVSSSLANLLTEREPIISSINRLHALVPILQNVEATASILSAKVDSTATTASRVGGRVKALDEEMRRVKEASDRVAQVMELKNSLAELRESIESQDWESATRHCSRAMSLPQDVISGRFAEVTVPTTDHPQPPVQALREAREHLLGVFRQNFEEASRSRDSAATSRYFKLFPSIGWEKEGLEAYAAFVVDLVRIRAPASAKTSSPLYYITSLTALFESIAMVVDQHQPVVEKYYGKGKMKSVVETLLVECDRVVKSLIEGFEETRSMKRKLSEVTSSAPVPIRRQTTVTAQEEEIDAREIDKVLTEVAGMSGRWNLFRKFMAEPPPDEEEFNGGPAVPPISGPPKTPTIPSSVLAEEPHPVEKTNTLQLFESLIDTYYIPMEVWYTRSSLDRAHRLSSLDQPQPPTTTIPDDGFYILKIILSRVLSTSSGRAVQQICSRLQDVIERDYIGVIKRKMDDVYSGAAQSAVIRSDKVEKELRSSFIMHLNDLDISASHLERLTRDLISSSAIEQTFVAPEQATVLESISSLAELKPKFTTTIRTGIEQLFNQLLRPRMRTFLVDMYRDVSYVLDEDAYAQAEISDVVRKRFGRSWEALLDGYKELFTDHNYRMFFNLVLDVMLRPWERFLTSIKYTDLGAVRFDRDLRSILAYLSSQTAFGDAREKFVRLQQISVILNLDADEDVDEFYNGSGISWKLGAQEARSIAALRV